MPTVWIPPLLRELTDGQETVTVPGRTVGEVIQALEERFPGIQERLCQGNRLRPGITVTVDGVLGTKGLREPVAEESEVHFVPAIGGG